MCGGEGEQGTTSLSMSAGSELAVDLWLRLGWEVVGKGGGEWVIVLTSFPRVGGVGVQETGTEPTASSELSRLTA